jgi:hypothetical protein
MHQDAEKSGRGLMTQRVQPKTEPRQTASLTALQFHVQMRHKNTYQKFQTSFTLLSSNLTFIGPCIVIYSYDKNQRDALFLKFILLKNYMFRTDLLSIMSLNTVYTAIVICNASYVDSLLARPGPDLASSQST